MDFKSLIKDPRDVPAPPGSINAELLALPQQRDLAWDMEGRVLFLPRTGHTVVPFTMRKSGYSCIVVDGPQPYPRPTKIHVSDLEMLTAIECTITREES